MMDVVGWLRGTATCYDRCGDKRPSLRRHGVYCLVTEREDRVRGEALLCMLSFFRMRESHVARDLPTFLFGILAAPHPSCSLSAARTTPELRTSS
jgi:hypothetical protein